MLALSNMFCVLTVGAGCCEEGAFNRDQFRCIYRIIHVLDQQQDIEATMWVTSTH